MEKVKTRVAINGFGRIGRMICRIAADHPELEIAAVNASYDSATLAHLLRYDTVHGRFHKPVEGREHSLLVGDHEIRLSAERNPALLPWREWEIDLVIDATGKFRSKEGASGHLQAGARAVLITAPAKGEDATFVYGVNHQSYDPEAHRVVSAASCTTTCLAPVVKVLHERFGIASALMTTVHSYTSDQRILDNPHKDLRRARGGPLSIIPTTTGAARAVYLVLPELKGKLNGFALRVPTPNVSLIDLTANLERPVDAAAINAAMREAAVGAMKGILAYTEEPLVSSDYIGDPHSAIIDGPSTIVGPNNLCKVLAWYDNEYGYSSRVVDLAAHMARTGVTRVLSH